MNFISFAASLPLPAPAPPSDFDLQVSLLGESRAATIARAVHEGHLDGYYCSGQLWVRREDIHDLLPPGHCTHDELDNCCFIPSHLVRSPA